MTVLTIDPNAKPFEFHGYETQKAIVTGVVNKSFFEIKEVRKNTLEDCTVKAFFGKCRIDIIEMRPGLYKIFFLGDNWCPDCNKATEDHTLESLGERLEELAQLTNAQLVEDKKVKRFLQDLTGLEVEKMVILDPLAGHYGESTRLAKMFCGDVESATVAKQKLELAGITFPNNDVMTGTVHGFVFVTTEQCNSAMAINLQ